MKVYILLKDAKRIKRKKGEVKKCSWNGISHITSYTSKTMV